MSVSLSEKEEGSSKDGADDQRWIDTLTRWTVGASLGLVRNGVVLDRGLWFVYGVRYH